MPDQADLVRTLYFGRDDAERDMADGLLRAGFLPTRAYEDALSGRKTLVIGRKGTGKSAICMQLAARPELADRTALITPDDAAGEELRRFELQGLTIQTAKSLIWRYVFAVQAARYMIRHCKRDHGKKLGSVRALDRFLRANGESASDRFYDRVLAAVGGLQASFSLEAFGVKASMDFKGQSEGAKAAKQLEIIEGGVARAFAELGCAQQHQPFLILVDQLEQVWSGDTDSNAMVRGLLLAGQQVAGKTYGGALRCVLFLRSDIYDSLAFGEGDKFRGDEMRIDWTADELCEVAMVRARASLNMLTLSDDELWTTIFPSRIGRDRMQNYLLNHALPRPRDVIQFLNLCRDRAASRGGRSIAEQDVISATQQFSDWKLQDLAREYQVNYPFLQQLFVVFQNTGYIVTRAAMKERFEVYADTLRRQFPNYANAFSVEGVLDILYGVGFIGIKRGGAVVYSWNAQVGIQSNEAEFHIHPCFRPALNTTRATDIHGYDVHAPSRMSRLRAANVIQAATGRDITIGYSPQSTLLDSLMRSCEIILSQLGRSGLPEEARAQVSQELGRVVNGVAEQRQALRLGNAEHPIEHVVKAAGYLDSLAAQLAKNGVADSERGQRLIRTIQDQARELIHQSGGGYIEPRS